MKKSIRIAVSVLLLSWIAWRTDWHDVGIQFAAMRVEMWFAALALYALAQFASARRWQLFARELRFDPSWRSCCAYYWIGLYFNLVLPTTVGGDVMRTVYLTGDSGRKWPALASVILERLNGLLVLIAAACVGVIVTPAALPWWIPASVGGTAVFAVTGLALLPAMQRWRIAPSAMRQQAALYWQWLRTPGILVETTIMSILVQVMGALILWCLGQGLGLNVPLAYYFVVVPMLTLLMMLPLSVNGMGVREGGMVLFLTPLGIDEAASLSLAFLWFSVGIVVSLLGGVVYLLATPVKREATEEVSNPLPV